MKKKWYKKSGIKAFFICLTIVFLVTACVSAGASVYVMSKGVQPLDSRKYVDSESFIDSVYSMSHTILESLKEREILDESSEDDLIDLAELKEGKRSLTKIPPVLHIRQRIYLAGLRVPGIKAQIFWYAENQMEATIICITVISRIRSLPEN